MAAGLNRGVPLSASPSFAGFAEILVLTVCAWFESLVAQAPTTDQAQGIRERLTQMDLDKDGRVTPLEWAEMAGMVARAENALCAVRAEGRLYALRNKDL